MSTAVDRGVHGRSMWMHHGCRCRVCHRALLDYSRVRAAVLAVEAGRDPATRVPVRRVRRHVERLRAEGWSMRAIGRAAGVSDATVARIASGARRVSRITECQVLAVGR